MLKDMSDTVSVYERYNNCCAEVPVVNKEVFTVDLHDFLYQKITEYSMWDLTLLGRDEIEDLVLEVMIQGSMIWCNDDHSCGEFIVIGDQEIDAFSFEPFNIRHIFRGQPL